MITMVGTLGSAISQGQNGAITSKQSPESTMEEYCPLSSASFPLSPPLAAVVPLADFARNLDDVAAAAVLIGVRGKQIVLLEWAGME